MKAAIEGEMDADPILIAKGLTRSFSGFTAVKNVDIKVRRNTIHSVIGPNGAGKSTLFNLLTRFLEADAGTITYNGVDVTSTSPAQLARQGVVRSFQISAVFPHLTASQNLCIPLQRVAGFTRVFWRSTACLSEVDGRVTDLLRRFGLSAYAHVAAGELPYGRKRALELATTFALEPELALLDEPMAGLGIEDVARVTDLIAEQSARNTIVMVEHNLKVVQKLDPRVLEAYIGH
jgi:branched-chain amino acid transport system ATP-binding protein